MATDPQSRSWHLIINRPAEHSITHEAIQAAITALKTVVYFCMADEVGLEEKTPHTHIYIAANSAIRFSTLKKRFSTAHIEQAHGSPSENRAYIHKDGKWANDVKHGTQVPGTFEEYGDIPPDPQQGHRSDLVQLYTLIEHGYSDAEILRSNPDLATHILKFDKIRQTLIEDEYGGKLRRDLQVIYVQGKTGVGKSRDIIERHGIEHCYRVLDYDANGKFDFYKPLQHDVMVLEEFRSNLSLGLLLNLTDIYPVRLSARYADKIATYHFIYIVSNWRLQEQYTLEQRTKPDSWAALLRRITKIQVYYDDKNVKEFTVAEYFDSLDELNKIPDWVIEANNTPPEDLQF